MREIRTILAVVLATLTFSAAPQARAQSNEDCLECHGKPGLKIERDGRDVPLSVDLERFGESLHGGLDCIDCHQDLDGVEKYPHKTDLDRVVCTGCHEDEDGPVAKYWQSTHGQRAKAGDKDAPLCQDCHGDHYIIPLKQPGSAISPFNIPNMCAQCHAEGAEVARTHDIPQEQIFERYRQSIHGEGLFKQGLVVTAVCTSCHTGHNVLPHTDPKSTIHRDNVVATCMQCHGLIEEVHRKYIAGELWEKTGAVPLCVECHSPHEVRRVFYDTNMSNADCLRCHAERSLVAGVDGRSLYVDADEHTQSIHGRKIVSCSQCHTGVDPAQEERPCATITERVNCAACHEAQVVDYERGRHGRLHAAGDPNAPYCTDCHGRHGMIEHEAPEDASAVLGNIVRESPTFARNVPALCAKCHRDGAPAAVRNFGPEEKIVEHYAMSIHGKGLLESGLTVTATCTNCHSAHKELPSADPESTVSPLNIAATCGQCHDGIYEKYQRSIHSEAGNPSYADRRRRGDPELPHCNDCHTAHTVARTDVPGFKLGIMTQCGHCHEDVTESYFDTYHGKASELGDTTKAKCYDCHGAHDILPTEDPRSRLSHDNIVATCGKCHPGSHRQFAGYLTHATHHDPDKYPALFYTFWGMTALLVGTFGFFGLHTLAWLPRSWRLRKEYGPMLGSVQGEKEYVRFTPFQRKLHLTVIISFFGLALTGMMLKFSYTDWAQVLFKLLGGTEGAGWIHRICAIATFGYFFAHLWNVGRKFRQGNHSFREFFFGEDTILPRFADLRDFVGTLKWFFGKGPRPRYGRWTYWEKFDYFAVFWGVAVIGSTGLCLWFPEFFTRFLPGWWINVATIIHSDEALLATGFIFTIHFFNTHFRPEKFPMDTVVFTGRMSIAELKHDKPKLYEQLVTSGELERHLADPPSPTLTRVVKIFGFSALVVGFTLVLLIIYAMLFAYR